jgi:hypothetical protein
MLGSMAVKRLVSTRLRMALTCCIEASAKLSGYTAERGI